MAKEMLTIYNEEGNYIGTKSYEDVHKDGDWHRVVGLFIINHKNEILMQRRSLKKPISPGLLTVTVGGHLWAGEDDYSCLKRESREEMGICIDIDALKLQLLYECKDTKITKDKIDNVFLRGYILHDDIDVSLLRYVKDEIEEFVYIHYSKLKEIFESGEKLAVNNNVMSALFVYMDKYTNK